MYSIFPAFVSALFLGCGIYAISIKGVNRVSASFFLLCVATAIWQGAWAVLFQMQSLPTAHLLIKIGYILILFLPTSFYLFLVEVCNKATERRFVLLSYAFASTLALSLLNDDLFLSGEYRYFFGYYPKAGILHPLHVLQTVVIALRCLYISYQKFKQTTGREQAQIKLCLISLIIYCFAALDYLCNYGIEFYPPGALFLVVSVGCFAWAIMRYDLMLPYSLAAIVAHEIRSPLVTIKLYSDEIGRSLPALCDAYRVAVEHGLVLDSISPTSYERLTAIPDKIGQAIRHSNVSIDTFLAVVRELDVDSFAYNSIDHCIVHAINEFPFPAKERDLITYEKRTDFRFLGSCDLLTFVLFNLIKNALWAIKSSKKGAITISTYESTRCNVLEFRDTALGISPDNLPYIFDEFFSTRRNAGGTGVGLSFCQHVIKSFGGRIRCSSEQGNYTTFFLEFPHTPA